jgi:ATPase subunit of ABC transporter with duplicated ATPase domains
VLDEPTNHLDESAAAFLEEQVHSLPGVVVVASHDRAFLDAFCTDLIDLDPAMDGPVRYGGNYSAYQAEKRAERQRRERRIPPAGSPETRVSPMVHVLGVVEVFGVGPGARCRVGIPAPFRRN